MPGGWLRTVSIPCRGSETPGAGFGTDTNVVVLLDREGGREDQKEFVEDVFGSSIGLAH